jgi:hypothetical protein
MPSSSIDAITGAMIAQIRKSFSVAPKEPNLALFHLLRLLAKWRAETLKAPAIEATGGTVAAGPFVGMKFTVGESEGCFLPKLLGCYEAELHQHWAALRRDRKYVTIIDIGAAEGYYAVGLARMFPEATVVARDTNATSQPMLRELARMNGVADRVDVGGLFGHADFAPYANQPVLVLCDIEGAEKDLLDPAKAPELERFDIVAEVHEGMDPTLPSLLSGRFGKTHDIIGVRDLPRTVIFPPRYQPRDSIDRLVSMWEFRSSPTPWLVMRAKAFPEWLAA